MNARKITALLFLLLAPSASAEPLTFSAMGCGPYNADAAKAMPLFVRQLNEKKTSEFLVHLGDIVTGVDARAGTLTDKNYSDVQVALTRGSKIPTYIVPGDNEWNDRPDPDTGWQQWIKYLLNLDRRFEKSWKTENQESRPENFAFVHKGVLIIGINLVGGRVHDAAEWKTRFAQNLEWIKAHFEKEKTNVRAAVILCQANPIGFGKVGAQVAKTYGPFVEPFGKLAEVFEKPVLFLHADGHKWMVDNPWKDAPNVTRVQVDLIASQLPPVQVTVMDEAEKGSVFVFDRGLKKGEPK